MTELDRWNVYLNYIKAAKAIESFVLIELKFQWTVLVHWNVAMSSVKTPKVPLLHKRLINVRKINKSNNSAEDLH